MADSNSDAQTWFHHGRTLDARNELAQAVEAYRRALELDPEYAEAWSNLGAILGEQGNKVEEIAAYRRALAINPQLAPVWSNLGNALREAHALDEALQACKRAIELEPGFAAAWNNLANALHDYGEDEKAVRSSERALQLAPGMTEAWSTLGGALLSLRRYDEAIHAHQQALQGRPDAAQLHFNLGVTQRHCGRNTEAVASLRRALQIEPGYAQAHYDLGFALLRDGELSEGWDEYEWRWRRPGSPAPRYDFTPWNGAASGRLLLWGEQGIGDHIIYASMVADLAASPLEITLEVDARLVSLYRRSFNGITVIAQQHPPGADPAAYDSQAPLPGLGRWLRPSLESFPQRDAAWLEPDAARARAYRERLLGNSPGAQRIVGISWRSANQELGPFKSSALGDWLGVLQTPGACFVDLQYGDTAQERAEIERQGGPRIEHLPDLNLYQDLEGLAALCAACDLVITVSNVTAHMAGALGRPVWLLLPKANGGLWYWFSGRTDSPWYPSMRIHTQQKLGSWSEVLEVVARELAAFVERSD